MNGTMCGAFFNDVIYEKWNLIDFIFFSAINTKTHYTVLLLFFVWFSLYWLSMKPIFCFWINEKLFFPFYTIFFFYLFQYRKSSPSSSDFLMTSWDVKNIFSFFCQVLCCRNFAVIADVAVCEKNFFHFPSASLY